MSERLAAPETPLLADTLSRQLEEQQRRVQLSHSDTVDPENALEPGDAAQRSDTSAAVFATSCRLPLQRDDPRRLLARVATLGRTAVPHASGLSVSLGSPIAPEAIGTESEFAQAVDGAQYEAGEGRASMPTTWARW